MIPDAISIAIAAVLALLVVSRPLEGWPFQGVAAGSRAAEDTRSRVQWREAPEYVALFAPRAHRDAYQMLTSAQGLDAVLQSLAGDAAFVRAPGSWEPRATNPLDAFGQGGNYDRWALSGVYGARQPRVARGPHFEGGRIAESWILVSPYPDPRLERLEPGTLLIVLRIP